MGIQAFLCQDVSRRRKGARGLTDEQSGLFFELERVQSLWENLVEINLTESGIHPYTLEELLEPEEVAEAPSEAAAAEAAKKAEEERMMRLLEKCHEERIRLGITAESQAAALAEMVEAERLAEEAEEEEEEAEAEEEEEEDDDDDGSNATWPRQKAKRGLGGIP